jgi:hypothetical protein
MKEKHILASYIGLENVNYKFPNLRFGLHQLSL